MQKLATNLALATELWQKIFPRTNGPLNARDAYERTEEMQNGRGVACLPSGKPMASCRVRPHLSAWPVISLLSTLALTRPYGRRGAPVRPAMYHTVSAWRQTAGAYTARCLSRANICIRRSSVASRRVANANVLPRLGKVAAGSQLLDALFQFREERVSHKRRTPRLTRTYARPIECTPMECNGGWGMNR